jgi:hypothetical protein
MLALVSLVPCSRAQAPILSQMSPASGEPGSQVTITGEKFGWQQGKSTVTFGKVPADIKQWSDNKITVVVPNEAPVGPVDVMVTIDNLKEDHPGKFIVSHVSPDHGPAETPVIITGKGFGNKQETDNIRGAIFFGSMEAKDVLRWSDEQIVVGAPDPGAAGNAPLNVTFRKIKATQTACKCENCKCQNKEKPVTVYSVLVSYSEGTFTLTQGRPRPADNTPPRATISPLSGPAETIVKITGSGFGNDPRTNSVLFGGTPATVSDGNWKDTEIDAIAPDLKADKKVDLVVTIVDGNKSTLFDAGIFTETVPVATKVDPSTGAAGTLVKITGSGFGKEQGTVSFGDKDKDVSKIIIWNDSEIDVYAPDLKGDTAAKNVIITLGGSNPKKLIAGTFTESPLITSITPIKGVASTQVTINGRGFGSDQGKSSVTFEGQPATVAATKGWSDSQIVVTAPDLKQLDNFDKQKYGIEAKVSVSVVGENKQTTSADAPKNFTETPPRWSDKDEKPLDIKFVGGFEQGFQSAQSSTSDGFLAVYGRALFLQDTFGPFYSIRLQTAPQASGTYGVVSLLSNPSGAVTTQSLQTVGSAVDLSLGLEYQIPLGARHWQRTLGVIAGGGFVTPLQVNSVSASYVMPAFGTVECTELQSRLSGVLSNPVFAGIKANTAPTSTSCYSNTITSTPTAVSTLAYAAPSQPNFYPKYFAGLRIVNRFAGATGLKQCDEHNPCERGFVDFTLGQNASVSGGSLKHLIAGVDSIYPLPVPGLNFIYLFGSTSVRLYNLPPGLSPLILTASPTSGSSTPPASPNPAVLVLPLTQPDRDFYRIGAGINLNNIFKALKPKAATNP